MGTGLKLVSYSSASSHLATSAPLGMVALMPMICRMHGLKRGVCRALELTVHCAITSHHACSAASTLCSPIPSGPSGGDADA